MVHNSGRVLVRASTRETAVSHQLKRFSFKLIDSEINVLSIDSMTGVSAATGLGQVLATRALESGILQVFVPNEYKSDKSAKVSPNQWTDICLNDCPNDCLITHMIDV